MRPENVDPQAVLRGAAPAGGPYMLPGGMTDELARRLQQGEFGRLRQATVMEVDLATWTAEIVLGGGGTQFPARCLRSYLPVVGDSVWCVQQGGDVLVIGSVSRQSYAPPRTVAVRNQQVTSSMAPGQWIAFTVGLPPGWDFGAYDKWTVQATAHEQPSGAGGAVYQTAECIPLNGTQFYLRAHHNWTTPLGCYVDYIAAEAGTP